MGVTINTVRDHIEHGYRLAFWCPRCKRGHDHYPLHRLMMLGKGDTPVSQLRLRHSCGETLQIVRMAPPYKPW